MINTSSPEFKRRKKIIQELDSDKIKHAFSGYELWKKENLDSGIEYAMEFILKEIEDKFGNLNHL